MSNISATLTDANQTDVSNATGYVHSAILQLESDITLLNNYMLTVSEYITDQATLDALTAKIGTVATDAHLVHTTVNQIAIMGENAFGRTRGTWHGVGTLTGSPQSAGVGKGS